MKGLEGQLQAPESPVASFDARAKVCAVFLTILTISSFQAEQTPRFLGAAGYAAILSIAAMVGVGFLLKRCLLATPFIAMAALLPLVSGLPNSTVLSLAVLLKAYSAILLLSVLMATTPIEDSLRALRAMGAPRSLALTTTLMYRYLFVLLDEWQRISRARACRTGGRPVKNKIEMWSNQLAMVFVRGWERAERVTAAMILRGFDGDFPTTQTPPFKARDWALAIGVPLAALVLRVS